jgi:hypothetical protein
MKSHGYSEQILRKGATNKFLTAKFDCIVIHVPERVKSQIKYEKVV